MRYDLVFRDRDGTTKAITIDSLHGIHAGDILSQPGGQDYTLRVVERLIYGCSDIMGLKCARVVEVVTDEPER